MHNCDYPVHHAPCCPCCGSYYQPYVPHYYPTPMAEFCSSCCKPLHECCCHSATLVKYPKELFADSFASINDAETFIGGESDVTVKLEYLSDGAATALINVIVDAVTILTITAPPAGYHVKKLPLELAPGSLIRLEVTDCRARLRWCEDLIC